ncbi:hypothetical protein [Dolosicoccus paucivorans]|nr:hypothetical protein [Dolosicoccus paucivorans]
MEIEAIEKALYIAGLIFGSIISGQKIIKNHLKIKKLMKELKEEDE